MNEHYGGRANLRGDIMAVFDIRGTHGSGKSYIVHCLLQKYGNKQILEDGKLVGHLIPNLDVAVVGPYTKVCGGCDAVRTQDEVCRLVRKFHDEYGKVILEGSLVGHTFSRYAALATEMGVDTYKFVFLVTPLEECIRRVVDRRQARGNTKEFDPKNVVRDHNTTQTKLPKKFKDAGYTVVRIINWRNPLPEVLKVLNK